MKTKKLSILLTVGVLVATRLTTIASTTTDLTFPKDTADLSKVKPKGPKPAWAPDIKPQMQVVVEKLQSYGDTPIPQLTPQQARKNHTATDAVMDAMKDNNIPMPVFPVDTMGKDISANGENIHVRTYTPQGGGSDLPVIVYYHGGGFVIANLDVYDASCKALSANANAIVVSVAYRLAPEHKFPTAHDDAFAAYKWVTENAASIKGDATKIVIAGESAGGNLAIATAVMARDKGVKLPVAILSVYPIAQSNMNTPSYQKFATAKPLDKPMMMWFTKHYTNNMAEAKDPRLNLVAANLKGLPMVTIINAELDPLQDDGAMLEKSLKAAGVKVNRKLYNGVTHEFFGMGAFVPQAKEAEMYAVMQLKQAFGK